MKISLATCALGTVVNILKPYEDEVRIIYFQVAERHFRMTVKYWGSLVGPSVTSAYKCCFQLNMPRIIVNKSHLVLRNEFMVTIFRLCLKRMPTEVLAHLLG